MTTEKSPSEELLGRLLTPRAGYSLQHLSAIRRPLRHISSVGRLPAVHLLEAVINFSALQRFPL